MANIKIPILFEPLKVDYLIKVFKQYEDTMTALAKLGGEKMVADYNESMKIINELSDATLAPLEPPACLAKECMNGNYCYKPFQCDFVIATKTYPGYLIARVTMEELPLYLNSGWQLYKTDNQLTAKNARKHIVIKQS